MLDALRASGEPQPRTRLAVAVYERLGSVADGKQTIHDQHGSFSQFLRETGLVDISDRQTRDAGCDNWVSDCWVSLKLRLATEGRQSPTVNAGVDIVHEQAHEGESCRLARLERDACAEEGLDLAHEYTSKALVLYGNEPVEAEAELVEAESKSLVDLRDCRMRRGAETSRTEASEAHTCGVPEQKSGPQKKRPHPASYGGRVGPGDASQPSLSAQASCARCEGSVSPPEAGRERKRRAGESFEWWAGGSVEGKIIPVRRDTGCREVRSRSRARSRERRRAPEIESALPEIAGGFGQSRERRETLERARARVGCGSLKGRDCKTRGEVDRRSRSGGREGQGQHRNAIQALPIEWSRSDSRSASPRATQARPSPLILLLLLNRKCKHCRDRKPSTLNAGIATHVASGLVPQRCALTITG